MVATKIFLLAILFVVSGGAVFSDWFRTHRGLTFVAGCVAILGSYYLFQSIYNDLKDGTSVTVSSNFSEEEVRAAAIQLLMGDPYGRNEQEVAQNISSIEFYEKGACGFGANWVVDVFVPQGDPSNNQSIKGKLHFDDTNGQFACWNLPFLN